MKAYLHCACLFASGYIIAGISAVIINNIRLSDGDGKYQGRVEINIDGVWGTVCDNSFEMADAVVMCRMMNLSATAYHTGSHFGEGVGPVFAREFHCNGYEATLQECIFVPNGFVCSHERDVGITCSACGEMFIPNGQIVSVSANGKTLTVSCEKGYEANTYESICDINGQWTPVTCYPFKISKIRLVNGIGLYDGRVEILVNDTWGTICSNSFGYHEANAICRILGYKGYENYYRSAYPYGEGVGPILVNELDCPYQATAFNNCTFIVENACTHYSDVAVACDNTPLNITDIRLVNGTGPYNGQVQVRAEEIWGQVCYKYIDKNDASTLCRMMNLSIGTYYQSTPMTADSTPALIGDISCSSSKDHINDCSYNSPRKEYCSQSDVLSLLCLPCSLDLIPGSVTDFNGTNITIACDSGYEPEETFLQCFENGSVNYDEICTSTYSFPLNITDIRGVESRIEIMAEGKWGALCYDRFDLNAANVICKMFGLNYKSYSRYWYENGLILIHNLTCDGSESHIQECSYNISYTCTQRYVVAVYCTEYPLNITNIRLNSAVSSRLGRVEVEVADVWGTVCDDNFGLSDALVVCRMLGFNVSSSYVHYVHLAYFGQGTGEIFVDDLSCNGDEYHINDCNYVPEDNCGHGEDVSVFCFEDVNITDWRLVNGSGPFDGRAEIKVNGIWGTICDYQFETVQANAFCDYFGKRASYYYTGSRNGQGSGPMYYANCSSSSISSCRYAIADRCTHEQDASVVCNDCGEPDNSHWGVDYFTYNGSTLYADCSYYKSYVGTLTLTCNNETNQWVTEGECKEYSYPLQVTDIRLVGGYSFSSGRVEFNIMDTWGTVCDHSFGINEAEVICSMAGFPGVITFYHGAYFGEGSGPIFVDELSCDENATDINNCSYVTYDDCSHSNDVSVVCTDCGDPTPISGSINSTLTNYGAVVNVTCDKNHRQIGDIVIICQSDGTWSDDPACDLIDCGDPTPKHGFSNASSTTVGIIVSVECNEGYDMVGEAIVTCQDNETWTDAPECQIKDCGHLSISNADINLPNNKTTFGETVLVSCHTGHTLAGNPAVSCLSNGSWEMSPSCRAKDCGDPTPINGFADNHDTSFEAIVEISCDDGYNISGNSTIICEDGGWSSSPVCDSTDCGLLLVPNGNVDDSHGRTVGFEAVIECDPGYTMNGSSVASCITNGVFASWNYSVSCEQQFCDDPTPVNGRVSSTDGSNNYVYENYAEIECNTGYVIRGERVITCDDGGVWSDNSTCLKIDCEPLDVPFGGSMDDSFGTSYNAQVTFSCLEEYHLVGEETTRCEANGEWSNESPACVAKSDIGDNCVNQDQCLYEHSNCIDSVCTCLTGIYDSRTKKCDTMPLMPFGTEVGDVAIPKRSVCGPKVTFEPGFPMFDKIHSNLYVCAIGYISFDTQFSNPTPPQNKVTLQNLQNRVLLAPFYGPIDRHNSGEVLYRSYSILDSHTKIKADAQLISYIEKIVMNFGNLDSFNASIVLIATWLDVKALGSGFDKAKTSTFQVVFVSDGRLTYALYIYGNGKMQWLNNLSTSVNIWVGYTIDSLTYTHPYSFSDASLQMDAKLSISSSKPDVSGLVFRPLYSNNIKQQSNAAVDCIRWYNENYDDKPRLYYIASLTPECPCDIRLSRFDPWFWKIGLYRWRQELKYKCVDMLHVGIFGHYGKSCCYDLNTWLWVYERPLAGSFQLYNERHPSEHKLNDEQPKENCCALSKYCNLYYELRPTGSCYKTSPYNFGTFWGDPHFRTLDGMNFTFNGLGEYTLLQVRTDNCTFDLQARTERALKEDGNLSDATVFTAFAAKDSTTDSSIHVERNKERTGIHLYGNAEDLTDLYNANTNATDPFVWSSLDNNLTIAKRNDSVNIFFLSCDISLTISINVEMLSLSTYVPKQFENVTKGLLGNYNGDATDDFTMPNGTVLQANLTEREMFAYGKTWPINTYNAAFVYDVGKSHADFHNETFVPRFLDEADPLLIAAAEQICDGSNNTECVFDYVFTENLDVAKETKKVKGQSDADKTEIEETVPTLEGCSTVKVTRGQNASCKLNVGDGETVKIVSSNVSAAIDPVFSGITFVLETDEPVTIRVASENQNGRSSPAFTVNVIFCTTCNGHGVCIDVARIDPRENEYFRYSTCECYIGYEGIDCEGEYDGCAANPCSLDRHCTTLTAKQQIQQNISYKCDPCPTGFEDDDEGECIDIDECAVSNGGCVQNCTNTDGSYECTCNTGYRVDNRNSSTCKDNNECEEATHNCDHICYNTEGGFTCHCHVGYDLNTTSRKCQQASGGSCSETEKDECLGAHGCTKEDNNQVCFCKDGFELDSGGRNCQDIDECSTGVCQHDCVNTNGSFECTCFTGYRLKGRTTCSECDVLHWGENCANDCVCTGRGADRCDSTKGCICESGWHGDTCNEDINECENEVQVCEDPRKACINYLGSYSCECRTGFHETDQGSCEDTDECLDPQFHNCTQLCTNTIGSYSCGCRYGYTKYDEYSCKDINECELRTSSCEQRCINNEGHYSCFCHFGYSLNDNRRTCSKILDPCLSIYNLTCSHFCKQEINNAMCGCKSGFVLKPNHQTCTDINECVEDGQNKCDGDAACINTEGSFLCECPDGKRLENDGRTCTECDNYHYGRNCMHTCSCLNGVCDKKTGCICNPGWAGTHCDIDINECSTEQMVCLAENSVCVNLLGSALCSCENGYQNNSGLCQDINECDDVATNKCDQICTNTEGSYTCSCQHGFILDGICTDIDECAGHHDCDQICDNTVGSYRCSCEDGFRLNLSNRKVCIPEHECSQEQSSNCPQHSTCSVTNDVVSCTCLKGRGGDNCIDIDECKTNINLCSQNCSNTDGSFQCNCQVGFVLLEDNVTCKECIMWKYGDNCGSACSCHQSNTETCNSLTGVCACKPGWTGETCEEDINECIGDDVCPNNSDCKNTNGGYICKCLKGYFQTGKRQCEECDFRHFGDNCLGDCLCNFENTDDCNHTTGECICHQGWTGVECRVDIDECSDFSDVCREKPHSICINTNGSFTCDCAVGFTDKNNMCEDIDECTESPCAQTCTNTDGSFVCSCSDGYLLQQDNVTCSSDSVLQFEAVVVIDIDLPTDTNLNDANVYNNIAIKLVATLRAYFRRFTDVWLFIIINDIRPGSIIANYTVRSGTADKDAASQLVAAVMELGNGTELVYDRQPVNASSESFNGTEPCEILSAIFGNCNEGYTCTVDTDIPVCKLLKEQSVANIKITIGLSAAGILSLIAFALLCVLLRRIRRGHKKKQGRNRPGFNNKRQDDEASDFNKSYKRQTGKAVDAGTSLPTAKVKLPRFASDQDAFN